MNKQDPVQLINLVEIY